MEYFRESLQEHGLLNELVVGENASRESNEPLDGKLVYSS